MGKFAHFDMGTRVERAEWEDRNSHKDSQGNVAELSRSSTLVVAASDASVKGKAGADYVCDGTADQVEIQAALDAVPTNGGKVVLLEGIFSISAEIDIAASNVSLQGMGMCVTTLKLANGANITTSIIGYTGTVNYVHISDLEIDGNRDNQSSGEFNGIALHGSFCTVERVYVHDTLSAGSTGYGIVFWEDNNCHNTVAHCRIEDANRAGIEFRSTGNDHNQILHNVIRKTKDNPHSLQSMAVEWVGEHNIALGNYIDNDGVATDQTFGFSFTGKYNQIVDNVILNCIGEPIYDHTGYTLVKGNVIIFASGGVGYNIVGEHSVFINNYVEDCVVAGVITGDDCIVAHNHFLGTTITSPNRIGTVIQVSGNRVVVDGNHIYRPYRYGIYLADGVTDIIITDNYIYKADANPVGIKTIGTFTNVIISSNRIEVSADKIMSDNLIADAVHSHQHQDIFMDVLAVSATGIRSNEDLSEAIPNTFTLSAQPDVPRTLSGHFDAHAQITAYTIVITGVNAKGSTVTETKTEADLWDWETSNAFATITSIIMTTRTGTGAGDTMDIGTTDVLGLSNKIYATGDIYKIKKNNANATVAVAQVDATYNTYDMAVIGLGATDDFTIWYKSNLNIVS